VAFSGIAPLLSVAQADVAQAALKSRLDEVRSWLRRDIKQAIRRQCGSAPFLHETEQR